MARHLRDKSLILGLEQLVAFDQAVIHLCDVLSKHKALPDGEAELSRLRDDHRRHLSSLRLVREGLGGATPLRASLGRAERERHASPRALLCRLAEIERRAHRLYHELLKEDLPPEVRGVLVGNLANEHVHAAWLEHRLRLYEAPAPELGTSVLRSGLERA